MIFVRKNATQGNQTTEQLDSETANSKCMDGMEVAVVLPFGLKICINPPTNQRRVGGKNLHIWWEPMHKVIRPFRKNVLYFLFE